MPLPTYPWQRKTYRLPETVESPALVRAATWHPLIGARYGTDTLEWYSSLDTSLHPWLADHCVDGRAILPGAAFAEMALAVARDWLKVDRAIVADLEITSPMQLTPDTSREVLCRLSPLTNHLEILSRPRLSQTPWQTHATAKIVRDATIGLLPEADDHAPLSPSHPVTGAEIYAMAERAGLQYGPSFRKLETAAAVRPDRIVLDLTKEDGDAAFGVDPARMDACFHALVLIFSSLRDAVHGTAYIPVRFGEITLRRPGATFTKARIDVQRRDERIIIANFLLTDEAGDVVVFMREARFQAIRTSRAGDPTKQMIYQTAVLAGEPTAARNDKAVSPEAFRAADRADPGMSDEFMLLEGWATALALQTARSLATANFIDVEALVETGRLPARTRPWLENMLVSLDRSGLCHRDRLGRHIDPEVELPDPDVILRTIAQEHQGLSAELLVAASTITAIDTIVAGTGDTLARPLSAKVVDGYELGSSQAHAAAVALGAMLRASFPSWPKDRAMRILQVGYGPLTNFVVRLIDEMQAQVVVFDPDRRRLERARISFAERGDLGFVDAMEDLPTAGFDIVVAAGALYRYRRRLGFWAGLRRVMARGALLAAIEPAPSFFRDLVLGLDARLSEGDDGGFDGQSVTEADWLETMQSVGLGGAEVRSMTVDAGAALLLTAQVEAERRRWTGSGTAIIVGDGDTQGTQTLSAFATLLASSGVHVSMVLDGEIGDEHLAETPAFVVFFASEVDRDVSSVKGLGDRCLRLKRLADSLGQRATRLWLVASGATAADGTGNSDVAAGLWAFSRTLANERQTLDMRRVDIADGIRPEALADRLRDLVLSDTNETEIVLRKNATHVVRFETGSSHDRRGGRAEAARLKRGDGSGIDRIHWDAIARQAPGPAEVEIAVRAIGLNFRDVMFGLGLLPEEILENGFAGPTLGLECSGRIERVGSAVKGLKPGDRVIAFAKNAFSTHVTTPAAVVAPIPGDLSFETAATIPVAFLTAYHALMLCARLKAGETVLIHGGAGGVGLAAIQIARWRGAHVIATAGSPEKRALLISLGAEHVFDSRSGAFAEDVRRVNRRGRRRRPQQPVRRGDGTLHRHPQAVRALRGARQARLRRQHPRGTAAVPPQPVLLRRRPRPAPAQRAGDEPAADALGDAALRERRTRALALPRLRRRRDDGGVPSDAAVRPHRQAGRAPAGLVGHHRAPAPRLPDRVGQAAPDHRRLRRLRPGDGALARRKGRAQHHAGGAQRRGEPGRPRSPRHPGGAGRARQGGSPRHRRQGRGAAALRPVRQGPAGAGRRHPRRDGARRRARRQPDRREDGARAPAEGRRRRHAGSADARHAPRLLRAVLLGDDADRQSRAGGLRRRQRLPGGHGPPPPQGRAAGPRHRLGRHRGRRRAGPLGRDPRGAGRPRRHQGDARAGRVAPDGRGDRGSPDADPVVTIAPINWSAARQHLPVLKGPTYRKLASQDEAASADKEKINIVALVARNTPDEARKIISGLIIDEIARVLRLPREDVARTTPLSEIGLDSLMAVELALGLEERFTLDAPLSTTASSFTVNELADHVIGLATGTVSEDDAIARTMMERHLGPSVQLQDIGETADLVRAKVQTMKGLLN